jgi:hypothetical protein
MPIPPPYSLTFNTQRSTNPKDLTVTHYQRDLARLLSVTVDGPEVGPETGAAHVGGNSWWLDCARTWLCEFTGSFQFKLRHHNQGALEGLAMWLIDYHNFELEPGEDKPAPPSGTGTGEQPPEEPRTYELTKVLYFDLSSVERDTLRRLINQDRQGQQTGQGLRIKLNRRVEVPVTLRYGADGNVVGATCAGARDKVREYFRKVRETGNHLGLGDIRLTLAQQEELARLV